MLRSTPLEGPLRGELRPPSDKSITHRALILAALASGTSRVDRPLWSADTRATRAACAALGAEFEDDGDAVRVHGRGAAGLKAPAGALDLGNSGTGMRLLAGVLAAQRFDSVLVGDASLSRRPMNRIVDPLRLMGARIDTADEGRPPLRIQGGQWLSGIDYESPVASAQVKSCLLLAGLFATGRTRVREPWPSRDHTERMLPVFGARLDGPCAVQGGARLHAAQLAVPADPSSAAFAAAAAALVSGSDVRLREVGTNPTRDRFFHVLAQMGAALKLVPGPAFGGEPVADIQVAATGRLRAVSVEAHQVPALIDELPLLMAVAARADGITRIRGAAELRVKESDRIAVMCAALAALGVEIEERPDGADIRGGPVTGGRVDAAGDHRCAMALAVLGMSAGAPVDINGADMIATSYPEFAAQMNALGADLSVAEAA